MTNPEFDHYSVSYEEMLKDPIRDRFASSTDYFHTRKRDLVRDHFHDNEMDTRPLSYLDVGCGRGELATLLARDFAYVAGCDPSAGMVQSIRDIDIRVQDDLNKLPFENAQFDFVTAVCVYHHVPVVARAQLTSEVVRLLRPGGVFAIIEHNPLNPATRIIVARSPIDTDAVLLRARETKSLMKAAGLAVVDERYFLYLPENLYKAAPLVERALRRVPFGGQYAVFGRRPA